MKKKNLLWIALACCVVVVLLVVVVVSKEGERLRAYIPEPTPVPISFTSPPFGMRAAAVKIYIPKPEFSAEVLADDKSGKDPLPSDFIADGAGFTSSLASMDCAYDYLKKDKDTGGPMFRANVSRKTCAVDAPLDSFTKFTIAKFTIHLKKAIDTVTPEESTHWVCLTTDGFRWEESANDTVSIQVPPDLKSKNMTCHVTVSKPSS